MDAVERHHWWLSKLVGDLKRCVRVRCVPFLALFTVAALLAYSYAGSVGYPDPLQTPSPAIPQTIVPPNAARSEDDAVKTADAPVMTSYVARQRCSSKTPDSPPTNIVFIKVHKAGSSTVSNMLARYALNHDLNIALPEQMPVGDAFHCFGPFHEDRVLPLAISQPYHVLFNHMFYNRTALDNVMPKSAFYVAIMRQPVKRFLSGAYYFGNLPPPAKNNTDNAAFKRFISEPSKSKLEKNFRIYNSVSWDTGLPLPDQQSEESVRRHLRRLDSEVDLMMVMERFLESLVLLRRRACLTLRDVVFAKINSRKTYNTHAITDQDVRQLRAWQMADHMAYDHFYAKFEETVRQEGPGFPREVEHFGRVMERVSRYCSGSSPKWEVLVIHRSPWSEQFSLNEKDCQLMRSDERELQRLLLARARDRRERAGYTERRTTIPKWNSYC